MKQGWTSEPKAVVRELDAQVRFLERHPDAARRAGERYAALELESAMREVAERPKDAWAWAKAARWLRANGKSREALAACGRALRLERKCLEALFTRLWCRLDRGQNRLAVRDGDRAVAVAPRSPAARVERATARSRGGDLAGARRDLDTALRLAPADPAALFNRGLLRMKTGDPRGAAREFRSLVKRDPDDDGAREKLAEARAAISPGRRPRATRS